ncbi:MAG: ISAs1 family transposase [Pseudoalteromonas tetraodonis]|mgnify:FL=1|jgi:predicted transposase YbfD/YdcC|uniref:ISAs1 family transposase n=5 Tax=Gammaproteobacteria TaxID=1236 RepID=A0ACD3YCW0_9GAMM|nr:MULTISPECIES: ISAs1 family transposase [Gammaproteobacteria]MCK8136359.1 ISAs1 family transposase [Pseudoalteromonas sp. 2CM28B]MDC9567200.1 ISAs1 family transposase [Pseudoalteromonas sp. GAB2316C]MDC9575783.1 ISAs1 family transposase [Pseudoalteromonas sp. GABNS16A]MDC9579898.1 ISAs1 family transposase [Pseudoalteromonas sp. GABNS16E]MDC9587640.1 ISAs1 family transposase [Pseudoalteromonas sp. GABNS16C]|tara:strand:+ start:84 stop:1220 length:1137 start_codon:yes stop_codon:yes gene_type:complete|eukprot:TRINITY_DN252_c0_g1_i1.p1 TRINITY_DN252_c0_g1~~TRINITY_DN252_c0_g1_i1.p1  ORF type:complete len:379 (+),score=69.27 TRINITY_DN252_c0_g1_i1:2012-3148(+)
MSATFLKHFNSITDPRIERCKKHELIDILLLAISAVISGAQGWEDIEDFGHLKLDWLKRYGAFNAGIPRHDTIARVICRLKSDEIEHAFQSWISSLIETTGADIIAMDGKTARRSFTTKDRKSALHTVSAWSCQHQLVLGQTAVDSKTNEITAIPELLTMLDIENSIITLDAMGCQQEIAKQIIKQKADYILALKGNHSGMQSELEAWWHKSEREGLTNSNYDKHTEISSGHGRIETRVCQQLLIDKSWLDKIYQWSGLKSVIQVTAEVHDKSSGTDTIETRWYISSLALGAEQALNAVRSHWQVESMHWMLDMNFREDESRIRKKQGPLVFNVMRKIAMALFKQDTTKTASMARKKKMAGLDDDYRSTLLESGIKMR